MEPAYYTSHNVKSRPGSKGIVMCPTVLAACCKYCGKSGHWEDGGTFCAAKRHDDKMLQTKKTNTIPPNANANANKKTLFSQAFDSDSEEEEIEINNNDEPKTTWASIAAKPKPVEIYHETSTYQVLSLGEKEEVRILDEVATTGHTIVGVRRSWNEIMDDDEEW